MGIVHLALFFPSPQSPCDTKRPLRRREVVQYSTQRATSLVLFIFNFLFVSLFVCHYQQKKSARAEEYIRMIKERLPEAVQQCIHAAAGEHEPAVQRSLLRVNLLSFSSPWQPWPRTAKNWPTFGNLCCFTSAFLRFYLHSFFYNFFAVKNRVWVCSEWKSLKWERR